MKNKFLTLCLSFLVAVAIWLYVITVVSPESQATYKDIPVSFQSETLLMERGLIISNISTKFVTLRLLGNRTDLVQLDEENIHITVDLSKIYEAGVHEMPYSVTFPGNIPNGAIEIQKRSPDTIQITVEERVTKTVEVAVSYKGNVPNGYLTDKANLQLGTNTIQVAGAKSVIDRIFRAGISIDLNGRTESINEFFPVTLYDVFDDPVVLEKSPGVLVPVAVNVNLQIKKLVNLPIKFDVVYGGGATAQNTTVTADMSAITVAGHKFLLEDLTEIHLGSIDLSEYTENKVIELPITLPAGVSNETGRHTVKVTITFRGLVLRQFSVSNFTTINPPADMNVEISQTELDITLRGPASMIEKISISDISVTVDLSKIGEETTTVVPTVTLPQEYAEVGVVGSLPPLTVRLYRK